MGKGSETSSQFKLGPEARTALTAELGAFGGTVAPQQQQLQQNLLQSLDPQGSPLLNAGAGRALSAAAPQIQGFGSESGLNAGQLAEITQGLATLQPGAQQGIESVAQGVAQGTNSFIDPRFAFALKPEGSSSTSQGSGATAAQGIGTAIALAALVA